MYLWLTYYAISLNFVQIERQPRTGGGTLKFHFDRLSKLNEQVPTDQDVSGSSGKKVVSQGTWKSKGRRGNQEDSFGKLVVLSFSRRTTDFVLC